MSKSKSKRVTIPVNPNDGYHEIMAISTKGQAWGRGVDAAAARKALRCNTSQPVDIWFVVPKGAWLDSMWGNRVEWKLDEAGDVHKDGCCPLCTIE